MDDIGDYEEQIRGLVSELEAGIELLPRMKGEAKNEKAFYLSDRMNRLKQAYASFKVELRYLPKDAAAEYEDKSHEYNDLIGKIQVNLNFAKADGDRNELLGESGPQAVNVDNMTTNEVLDLASAEQDDTLDSLGRSKHLVQESHEIGTETAEKLVEQTEQLQRIDAGVDRVEANLYRADKQIKSFLRRVMTDKMILIFIVLIVLAMLVVIIIKIVKPDAGFSIPSYYSPAPGTKD